MTTGDPLVEYREALLNRLEAQPAAFAALVTQLPEPEWRVRPGIDGLTLHQLAVHVRDAEAQAFYPRVERILAEDEPHLEPFPHHYATLEQGYRIDEPLRDIVAGFAATHAALLARLRALSLSDWSRIGFHPPSGPRTVLWWAERIHGHAATHLQDLRRLIAG